MRNVYLILLFALVGCTTSHTANRQPSAWLKPGVKVNLPAPSLGKNISEQQLLTAKVKEKSFSLVALLEVNDEKLSLAGLSSMGIRLFLVNYDGQNIYTEQFLTLPELPPAEQVLADIMLSYWPIASWSTNLPKGWTLVDQGTTRELRDAQQRLITQITYQVDADKRVPIQVDNQIFGYQIMISRLGQPT